jgi:hypothetical protein
MVSSVGAARRIAFRGKSLWQNQGGDSRLAAKNFDYIAA